MQMRQVLAQLDLNEDQKSKIQDIIKQAQQDLREKAQALQNADADEKQSKMQDLQNALADTKDKVEAALTADQRTKYFPLIAKAGLKQTTDLLAALKTASAKQEISDDLRKQLDSVIDDSQKTLDGFKTDADAVADSAAASDFQQKIMKFQMDLRKQIVDIIGQEDAQALLQSARQSMAPAGAGGGRRANRAAEPATAPAAK
jgi:hypothetical protein